ncbi:hypothetical protein GCM10022248_40130 [Nonomuraea soli]
MEGLGEEAERLCGVGEEGGHPPRAQGGAGGGGEQAGLGGGQRAARGAGQEEREVPGEGVGGAGEVEGQVGRRVEG